MFLANGPDYYLEAILKHDAYVVLSINIILTTLTVIVVIIIAVIFAVFELITTVFLLPLSVRKAKVIWYGFPR